MRRGRYHEKCPLGEGRVLHRENSSMRQVLTLTGRRAVGTKIRYDGSIGSAPRKIRRQSAGR